MQPTIHDPVNEQIEQAVAEAERARQIVIRQKARRRRARRLVFTGVIFVIIGLIAWTLSRAS